MNMKSNMKILKKLKISEVIIKPENIREIAEIVYKEYSQDLEKNQHLSLKFILKSYDNTQYESEDMDIFSDGGILDSRRIIAIEMECHNYSKDKRLFIDLEHTAGKWSRGNEVMISGCDEMWANGVLKSIENSVSNWKKQETWPYKYKWPLTIIFAIGIGLLYLNLSDFIFSYVIVISPMSPKPQWAIEFRPLFIFSYYSTGFILGLWPASSIVDKICKLYPCVEFILGPEHFHIEEKRRAKLYKTISMGVIPLVISIIIELTRL